MKRLFATGLILLTLTGGTFTLPACGPKSVNTTLTQPQTKVAQYGGQVISSLKVAQDFIVQSGAPESVIGAAQNQFLTASKAGTKLAAVLDSYDAATTAAARTLAAKDAQDVLGELQSTVDAILAIFNQPGIQPTVKTETARLLGNVLKIVTQVKAELKAT